MAGDVDALEVTLGGLQDELDALKGAHDALEDLVALKADTKDLEKAVADLQGDVKKVSDALANYATADELDKAVADVSAQVKEVVEGLQGQIDALKSTSATKDDLKKVSDDLAAAKTDLQKSITAVEEATKALANGAVKENTEAIAKLDEAVKDLQGDVKTLDGTVKELGERITKAEAAIKTLEEKTIPALEKAIEDVEADLANYVTKDALNELIKNYASAATVKAVQDALIDAQAQLSSVAAMLNTLIAEVYGLIQSLVFVPEYDDLAATAYGYKLDGEYLNDQVVVRGTYQVTPFAHVNKIGTQLVVKAVLQEVDTRSAETPYIWAETVNVTATNDATGKFDIDAVFDIEKYDTQKQYVLTVYVQHPEEVNQDVPNNEPTTKAGDDIDEDMGVTGFTESIIQNYMASNFVSVVNNTLDITQLYRLVKNNKAYARVDDSVEWSATAEEMNKAPFAGHEVMLELETGKYTSLEDAAKLFCVEPELITPKYWQNEVKMGAKNIKNFDYKTDADFENHAATVVCNVHGVAAGTTAWDKVYTIVGEPTRETAKNFVGHRLFVEGYLYFGKDVTKVADLQNVTMAMPGPVEYTYTIDYRTASLRLSSDIEGAHSVAWNYETAKALSSTKATPYDKPISTLGEQFSEYEIVKSEKVQDIDYKKVMEAAEKAVVDGDADAITKKVVATPAKVNNVNVAEPTLVITPETHLLAEIASVDVTGYQFYSQDVKYAFKHTYRDYASFTKVEYLYDLTLGAKPDKIEVTVNDVKIPYTNKLAKKEIAFQTLAAKEFGPYLPAATVKYSPYPADVLNAGLNTLKYGLVSKTTATGAADTNLDYYNDVLTVTKDDVAAIFTDQKAAKKATITKTATTWFDVDFVYTVNFEITEPAYAIAVLPTHVAQDADGNYFATTNYHYTPSKYAIDNSNMAHYFKVNGVDTDNLVQVSFVVKPVAGTKTPKFQNGYDNILVDVNEKGEIAIDAAVLSWGDYEYTEATIEAKLFLNNDYNNQYGPTVKVKVIAQDPLSITGNTVKVNRVPNAVTTVSDVRAGADVHIIGDVNTITADRFATNASASSDARKASAYDATVTVDKTLTKVYYIENGQKVDLPTTNYTLNADHTSIELQPETTALLIPVYAEFGLVMDYTLDGGKPKTTTVTYVFEYNN